MVCKWDLFYIYSLQLVPAKSTYRGDLELSQSDSAGDLW